MTIPRRRILRPQRPAAVEDPRRQARLSRQREQLAKSRSALKRWLTRLKRATGTVTELHQRICRLEALLAQSA